MGEIADMMCDGTLDSITGEFLDGKSPGYPRHFNNKRQIVATHKIPQMSNIQHVKSIVVKAKCYTKWYIVAWSFLNVSKDRQVLDTVYLQDLANHVNSRIAEFEKYCLAYKRPNHG